MGGVSRGAKEYEMFCPRCKQVFRKVVFGIACGCTLLTGQAEEPLQGKFYFEQQPVQQMVLGTSSVAPSTTFTFKFGGRSPGGST